MLVLSQFYPFETEIDGEPVKFRIKRMTEDEGLEFKRRARLSGEPTFVRFVERDKSGPEQERNANGEYKISLLSMADRKVTELSPERRREFEAALVEDENRAQEFLKYIFRTFIKCASGLIEELEDGTQNSVSEGIDVLRLFGAREDVLSNIVGAVREENTLSDAKKKPLKSASDFTDFSSEPAPAPDGPKPETIATSAEQGDLIKIEDASEGAGLSGLTATSRSIDVQSPS